MAYQWFSFVHATDLFSYRDSRILIQTVREGKQTTHPYVSSSLTFKVEEDALVKVSGQIELERLLKLRGHLAQLFTQLSDHRCDRGTDCLV